MKAGTLPGRIERIKTMIMKTLTAGVLAASLAITSLSPTQASAGLSDDEVAGLLTLLFLGAVIHNNRNNDPAPVPQPVRPRADDNWRVLPLACLQRIENRRGQTVRFFGQRCLTRSYNYVSRLPQACHIQFRTENGQRRQGFSARCLRDAGFRTNRH